MKPLNVKIRGTQHTPGPWTFNGNGLVYVPCKDGASVLLSIAEVRSGYVDNARLIAAAPDLLALAQTIHAWLVSPALDPYTIASVQRQAAEAIAKATGN